MPRGAVVALAVLAALAVPGAASTAPLQGTISYGAFRSAALEGTMHYAVYLPPGYRTDGTRYPVVYYLHGLPASPTAYRNITALAQALELEGDSAIVVGVQGARGGETDPEYLDRGPGHRWETAVAHELVGVVDTRYRTVARRSGRMIVGISAGGYGATLVALHNPGLFGAVESWSGYFHATNPSGTAALDLGSLAANERADARKLLPQIHTLARLHTFFGFYVGDRDTLFRGENQQFHRLLVKERIPTVFRLYSGGHDWNLWRTHAPEWLDTGLTHLPAG